MQSVLNEEENKNEEISYFETLLARISGLAGAISVLGFAST